MELGISGELVAQLFQAGQVEVWQAGDQGIGGRAESGFERELEASARPSLPAFLLEGIVLEFARRSSFLWQ